jgi:Na+/proline symporter/nitrogen-specific signal transduction histidine kinase
MLDTGLVVFTSLAYVSLLFVLAFISDRRSKAGKRGILGSPVVYTLSISVYCTSWTFYGAVGSAARNGLEFAAIYIGPTLVFVGWWYLLRKMVRISKTHRITSIADFISSRYGKSTTLAVMVTLIAVVAATPYISLQLKAVTISFAVVAQASDSDGTGFGGSLFDTAFWVAAAMAVFTILFGTRNVDADEHHPGVVAAIAFESLVKLMALIAVGLFVVFGLGAGLPGFVDQAELSERIAHLVHLPDGFASRWLVITFLSATAILCLPRQFQVTVVEISNEKHLATAAWLFPLYLFLISLFIIPIAIGGLVTQPEGANPDLFVLTVPMSAGQDGLALFAFIGGFSSATSMVIVACIALSIMISNHIVMPVLLRIPRLSASPRWNVKSILLNSRRIAIALLLLLGWLYYRVSSQSEALAAIGLISFAGVAQFLPALLAGLFWRGSTARGAVAGLGAGSLLWAYTLLLPSLERSGWAFQGLIADGPFGIALLRPEALFGGTGWDPLVHALFWSLSANVICHVLVSLLSEARPLERLQGALFIDVFRNLPGSEPRVWRRSAAVEDLYMLAQRIIGPEQAVRIFSDYARGQGGDDSFPDPDPEFIAFVERQLAGSIGAASARTMVSRVATGETLSLREVMKILDETQQVIAHSHRVEQKSRELETTAEQLRNANAQLKRLDTMKDDFLSRVSHEVRTPMTSIRSFSELLLDLDDLEEPQARRFLDIIVSESQRLTRLLDEILDLSRLENDSAPWPVSVLAPNQVLADAVATMSGLAERSGTRIVVRMEAQSAWVSADRDRLMQVFINLLSNAIKYNDSSAPQVTVTSISRDGEYRVHVADNGPGIGRTDQSVIFSKFARGWDARDPSSGSSGLGLAISRLIMQRFGGNIWVESVKGAGATFSISLPLVGEPSLAAERARAASHV